jgi:hypothetical protein
MVAACVVARADCPTKSNASSSPQEILFTYPPASPRERGFFGRCWRALDVRLPNLKCPRERTGQPGRWGGNALRAGAFLAALHSAILRARTVTVRFEMNLVPEGEGWKVVWASWSLVSEGTGP